MSHCIIGAPEDLNNLSPGDFTFDVSAVAGKSGGWTAGDDISSAEIPKENSTKSYQYRDKCAIHDHTCVIKTHSKTHGVSGFKICCSTKKQQQTANWQPAFSRLCKDSGVNPPKSDLYIHQLLDVSSHRVLIGWMTLTHQLPSLKLRAVCT